MSETSTSQAAALKKIRQKGANPKEKRTFVDSDKEAITISHTPQYTILYIGSTGAFPWKADRRCRHRSSPSPVIQTLKLHDGMSQRHTFSHLSFICTAILGLLMAFPGNGAAQRGKKTAANTPKVTPQELMEQYRFQEARTLLEQELTSLKRSKMSTLQVEADLRWVGRAEEMLSGTERVNFVDSLVVSRDSLFQAFSLSPDCGSLGLLGTLISRVSPDSPLRSVAAHKNELADCIYYACPDSSGDLKICSSELIMQKWSEPTPLPGLAEIEGNQNYPFVMQDGVTLYFASQNEEGLGGYDLYVTRYNADSKTYVQPENLGMPFNSAANDYMLVIDEVRNVGWFVTDRRQPADKVCIYFFLPSESREVFTIEDETDEAQMNRLRRAAMIASIGELQDDTEQVAAAYQRLHSPQTTDHRTDQALPGRFVITDDLVYTDLAQFKSAAARRIAEQWAQETARINRLEDLLDKQRRAFGKQTSTERPDRAALAQLESDCAELRKSVQTLAKNMRRAELGQ